MKKILSFVLVLSVMAALGACEREGANIYSEADVGKSMKIEFGRILSMRPVKIKAQTTGAGILGGSTAGGLAGSQIGNGNGSVGMAVGGVILGAIVGNVMEQKLSDRDGIEYVIARDDGKTVSVAQNIEKDDPVLKPGDRVMVQIQGISGKGSYMRVLPAGDNAPPAPKHRRHKKSDDEGNKEDPN